MKISETTIYPYPLLAPWSNDISESSFNTEIRYREDNSSQQLSMHFDSALTNDDISRLIDNGSARFGCFIRCKDTGLRRVQPLGFPQGIHDFAPGALLGRVEIRPMIWTTKSVSSYLPLGAHFEFHESDLESGKIIALGEEQILHVTHPALPTVESIFEIDINPNLPDGKFEIDMGGDKIVIRMPDITFSLVQLLRQTDNSTKIVTRTSLFIPTLMYVLDQISKNGEQFEGLRWYNSFSSRCDLLSINKNNPDLLNDAMKLLDNPFMALECLIESRDE